MEIAAKYRAKTNHAALKQCASAVCWELVFKKNCTKLSADDPNTFKVLETLKTKSTWNPKADVSFLFSGVFSEFSGFPLLGKAMDSSNAKITTCKGCLSHLEATRLPPRSIANKL
jgi:hypothetical protein